MTILKPEKNLFRRVKSHLFGSFWWFPCVEIKIKNNKYFIVSPKNSQSLMLCHKNNVVRGGNLFSKNNTTRGVFREGFSDKTRSPSLYFNFGISLMNHKLESNEIIYESDQSLESRWSVKKHCIIRSVLTRFHDKTENL